MRNKVKKSYITKKYVRYHKLRNCVIIINQIHFCHMKIFEAFTMYRYTIFQTDSYLWNNTKKPTINLNSKNCDKNNTQDAFLLFDSYNISILNCRIFFILYCERLNIIKNLWIQMPKTFLYFVLFFYFVHISKFS